MKIIRITLLSILVFTSLLSCAQKNPSKQRFDKISLILKNKYPELKKGQMEITIFGNKECGRCTSLVNQLRKSNIPFIEYELKIFKNAQLMRKICNKQSKDPVRSIHYPVVLLNNKAYWKIGGVSDFGKYIISQYKKAKND